MTQRCHWHSCVSYYHLILCISSQNSQAVKKRVIFNILGEKVLKSGGNQEMAAMILMKNDAIKISVNIIAAFSWPTHFLCGY